MAVQNKHICVVDMGSAYISAVIAEIHADGVIEVLGFGHTQNRGVQRGKIIDMDKVVACLKQAVSYAEDMADCRVYSAWLCLSSASLNSFNCSARVAVENVEISTTDIVRTLSSAKSEHLLDDYYLVNHFQHGISIDNNPELTMSPIAMVADHIEAYYHMMMVPIHVMQNLEKAMRMANLYVERTLLANIASSSYALLPDEREQGVCMVDIGAGTTSISIYYEDKLLFTKCLTVGGYDVSRDIATELRISMIEAERIKTAYGKVNIEDIDFSKMIAVASADGMGSDLVSARELGEIMTARYTEILTIVMQEVINSGLSASLKRGVVYCGGGTQVENFARFASKVTGLSAHKANFPTTIVTGEGKQKRLELYQYQTSLGALIYSQSEHFELNQQSEPEEDSGNNPLNVIKKPFDRLMSYLSKVF